MMLIHGIYAAAAGGIGCAFAKTARASWDVKPLQPLCETQIM